MALWGFRQKRTKARLLLALCACLILPFSRAHAALDQNSKLDQLFMWKMSEELQLSVKQEQQLNDIVKDLNQRRKDLTAQMQALIAKNAKLASAKELATGLKDYRQLLKKQLDLNLEEMDRVKGALGAEKFAQYLMVKNELSLKVKSLLLKNPDDDSESKSP